MRLGTPQYINSNTTLSPRCCSLREPHLAWLGGDAPPKHTIRALLTPVVAQEGNSEEENSPFLFWDRTNGHNTKG
jgi:hypothetical protein